MQPPEIIGSLRSSYTRAICMACIEKAIPYRFTECLLGAPQILAVNPFGKMPILRHGDFDLYESRAIACYLDRTFAGPPLFPSDAVCAAHAEQWISVVNSSLYGTFMSYLLAHIKPTTTDGSPDAIAIAALKPQLQMQLSVLDQRLMKAHYLAGDELSFADLNLVPILHNLRLIPGGSEVLAAQSHLARYLERLAARHSYAATIPPPGPPRRGP